jgi:GNAT superfamily N-acetyltransferase
VVSGRFSATPVLRYADRVDEELDIEICPLLPSRAAEFLQFLGEDAFADHPRWAGCYCVFPHAEHAAGKFNVESRDANRAAAAAMVAQGTMRGYFAYVGGRAVAWCNANLLSSYTIFDAEDSDPAKTGAIGCFVVVDRLRGKGIAKRLLEAALEGFRAEGVTEVVAFPRPDADSAADNHLGPLSLYLGAGFEEAGTVGRSVKVRKRL